VKIKTLKTFFLACLPGFFDSEFLFHSLIKMKK
jgi:hypothetical protein